MCLMQWNNIYWGHLVSKVKNTCIPPNQAICHRAEEILARGSGINTSAQVTVWCWHPSWPSHFRNMGVCLVKYIWMYVCVYKCLGVKIVKCVTEKLQDSPTSFYISFVVSYCKHPKRDMMNYCLKAILCRYREWICGHSWEGKNGVHEKVALTYIHCYV